jgi:hypothetical protein
MTAPAPAMVGLFPARPKAHPGRAYQQSCQAIATNRATDQMPKHLPASSKGVNIDSLPAEAPSTKRIWSLA